MNRRTLPIFFLDPNEPGPTSAQIAYVIRAARPFRLSISRRGWMLGSASALILAACTAKPTPSQAATDAALLATGVASLVTALQTVQPPVAPDDLAKIQGYLTVIQQGAASLAAATAGTSTTAQAIAAAVQEIAVLVTPYIPGIGPYKDLINAAITLLPTFLASAGVAGARADAVPAGNVALARALLAAGVK